MESYIKHFCSRLQFWKPSRCLNVSELQLFKFIYPSHVMFFPCTLLSLTNIYLTFEHSTDPVSETLRGDRLVFWEHKMTHLFFCGKTKWINPRQKSTKFTFKAYLGKSRRASSSLCNKLNIYCTGRLYSSHIACTALAGSLGRHKI